MKIFDGKTMGIVPSIIWIILGIAVIFYIYLHNKKMQDITVKMIDMIEESNKMIDDVLAKVKECDDEETRHQLIGTLEKEAERFLEYEKDEKNWPEQGSRIIKHIKDIRVYVTRAKEIDRNYENNMKG